MTDFIDKNIKKSFFSLSISLLLFLSFSSSNASIDNIDESATLDQLRKLIIIDASELANCQKESVASAKCIPANTFQSDQGELASFYHISWVMGTAGIDGSEEILVFAENDDQRDALLGLLYLAGQKKLFRWNATKSDLQNLLGKGLGQTRSIIRTKYYTAKMRDGYLVLPNEIEALKKKGWKLSIPNKLTTNQSIITGEKVLEILARFSRSITNQINMQNLKLLIHPLQSINKQ